MRSRVSKDGVQKRVASWTGEGEVLVRATRGERATVWDTALAIVLCLSIDVLALGATVAFRQRDELTICSNGHCYDNPQAHVHDGTVALIAYGVAVIGMIVLVQAVIGALVVLNTVPKIQAAQRDEKVLEACHFGGTPPCGHLRDFGPG